MAKWEQWVTLVEGYIGVRRIIFATFWQVCNYTKMKNYKNILKKHPCSKVKWIRNKEDPKLYMSPQKMKNGITMWSRNSSPGYIPKRIESLDSTRYLYTCVHTGNIFSSQNVEVTHGSIHGWTHKQKRGVPIQQNIDESWGHYVKRHKLVTKSQILCDSTKMSYLE